MFFNKKSKNNLVDFLASFSAIAECATTQQMDLFMAELDPRLLKVVNRFLRQRATFSSQIPRSNSTGG